MSSHALHYSTQHTTYKQRFFVLKCTKFVGYGSDSIVYLHQRVPNTKMLFGCAAEFRRENAEETLTGQYKRMIVRLSLLRKTIFIPEY